VAWAKNLIKDDLCEKFSFETYEREVERYGGPDGMAASERFFGADSRLVAGLIAADVDTSDVTSLVVTIDSILGLFGLGCDDKMAWLRTATSGRHLVGSEYRSSAKRLILAVSDSASATPSIYTAMKDMGASSRIPSFLVDSV